MLPTFDFVNIVRTAAKAVLTTLISPVAICTTFALVSAGVLSSLSAFLVSNYLASVSLDFSLPSDDVGLVDLCLYVFSPDDLLRVAKLMLVFIPAFFTFCISAASAYMAGLWVYRFAFAARSAAKDATL